MSPYRAVFVILAVLLFAGTATAVQVTFQLNMFVMQQEGVFDPGVDVPGVLGSFNNWYDDTNFMTDIDNDLIYQVTYDIDPGTDIDYKFVYYDGGDIYLTVWETNDTRNLVVPNADVILPVEYFSDDDIISDFLPYEMLFQVDMSIAIQTGEFDPDNDGLIIRGGHPALGNWGGYTPLSQVGGSDIYTTIIQFDELEVGSTLQWKYVIDDDNDMQDPVTWEELPQGGNREYVPTGDEPDGNDNGFLDVVHSVVFWADNPGGINQHVLATFILDGRPALRKHADVGIPGVTGDEIGWFTITGPWDDWNWTPNELGNHNLFDDGVAPDVVAGDSIFTGEVLFLAGSPVNTAYKYGANGGDNEAEPGENHFTLLPENDPFHTVEDIFGSIGDLYDDWMEIPNPPLVTVNILPQGTVNIPRGGTLFWNLGLEFGPIGGPNTADIWTEAVLPSGDVFSPVAQYSVPVWPGMTINVTGAGTTIPMFAPLGTYSWRLKVGMFPNVVVASDEFNFFVVEQANADGESSGHREWSITGLEEALPSQRVVASEPAHARTFALGSIYPNPFNAQATVTVTLPDRGELRVALYDVLGREVAVLLDEVRPAGSHSLSLDASRLASGLYFVRATTGGQFALVRKVVVVK